MSESQQSIISCLYLPIHDGKLLLPNVSVAEVVDYQEPIQEEGSPDYLLGKVKWRGIHVPVISFELANSKKTGPVSKTARLAVINSIGENQQHAPFFALVTQGIPRLVKVSEDLVKSTRKKKQAADAAIVRVDGEEATIPNIDHLESLIVEQR